MPAELHLRPISQAELLIEPRRRFLEQNEVIETPVKGIDGTFAFDAAFRIGEKLGEGYAGQVYRVVYENTQIPYALKVLRPEKESKEKLRNIFYRLSFGANFAPAISEDALRYGLIWQALLRRGAGAILPEGEAAIPEPVGYFWVEQLQAFAEVQEFIEGAIPIPDNREKNKRKDIFMNSIATLAENMGGYQIARQYKKWTLLAGANVVEKEDGSLVAIDWRSGIALPFFLPLSPGDIPIILDNLRHGHFVNFDYADFDQLDRFIEENKEVFTDLIPLVDELKTLDTTYRQTVQKATTEQWEREKHMDQPIAETLRNNPHVYQAYLFNDNLPFIGQALHRILYSATNRAHLQNLKTHDVASWQRFGRLTEEKARHLDEKTWLYALHKLFFSHGPTKLQKLTDNQELLKTAEAIIMPLKVIMSKEEQVRWLDDKIQQGLALHLITPDQVGMLQKQAREDKMKRLVIEMVTVVPFIEITTAIPTIANLIEGNYLVAGILLAAPITLGGVTRSLYTIGRALGEIPTALKEKRKKPIVSRLSGILIAPLRGIGPTFLLPNMAIYYPEMASLLTQYYTTKVVRKVPIYGLEGGQLERMAYEAPEQTRRVAKKVWKKVKGIEHLVYEATNRIINTQKKE